MASDDPTRVANPNAPKPHTPAGEAEDVGRNGEAVNPADTPTPIPLPTPTEAYERYEAIFGGKQAPFAFVDLDAVWSNAAEMLKRAAGKPIRIASKSVRCRPLLDRL